MISSDVAVELLLSIIKTKYTVVFNQLLWGEYNSIVNGTKTQLTTIELFEKWEKTYVAALRGIRIQVLHIPLNAHGRAFDDFLLAEMDALSK